MSRATVQEILVRIDQLPAKDRALLEDLLAEREEEEWQREAANARKRARRAGIDQDAIDQAVLAERYGE